MTEETNALQSVADAQPAEAQPAEQPAKEVAPSSATEQTADQQPEEVKSPEPEKPKGKSWEQRRIDQLTAKIYQEKREKEELKAKYGAIEAAQPAKADDVYAQAKKAALAELQQQQYIESFNRKCEEVNDKGISEFPDFRDTLEKLGQVGLITNESMQFLEIVTELPDSHKLLYHLGKNPDEAERLTNLSPTKQAIELAKLEVKISKQKEQKDLRPVSKAPPPIKPISGTSSTSSLPDDPMKMDKDQYKQWRANGYKW
jgi:hypothetical protein